MITKTELMDFVREFSLRADIIEKDYVLGWVLAGIANQADLAKNMIFKGGTCLKKCYFETYRFSEDLDYTLIDGKLLDESVLLDRFKRVSAWVKDVVGIDIPLDSIRFEKYQNNSGKTSMEGRIGYVGPLRRQNSIARIKLDLTQDEIVVNAAELREVHHPYSDKPDEGIKANCYSFSEVFAEKIRALSERARPRDLYDVIHLYRHANKHAKPAEILKILRKKCEYKNIPVPSVASLKAHPRLNELETEWENMLSHQLPTLPPREQFWNELPALFDWLDSGVWKGVQQLATVQAKGEIDHTWQPPSMIHAWHQSTPLELVRYAGANHLCIELAYDNSKRLIEPYDFKRTKAGELLIIAARHDTGEWRTYRVDRIQGLKVTQVLFVPRAIITLTPFV